MSYIRVSEVEEWLNILVILLEIEKYLDICT